MSDASTVAPVTQARVTHPRGLYVLFATEMWERFSYYGMRALLVLYLLRQLGWQPADSSSVYKWYTSLVYLTPLLGGFLADRYLGLRAAIIAGAVLMAIGHFLMAFPSITALFAALGFLVAGNGLFKPNISTLVGRMYGPGDARRNGAFTIFYMGINVGAALAPLVCGWLRQNFGFHYGFAAAGVGMVIGLLTFLAGERRVRADVEAAGNGMGVAPRQSSREKAAGAAPLSADEAAPGLGGFAGMISAVVPLLLIAVGLAGLVWSVGGLVRGERLFRDVLMPVALALVAITMGLVLRTIRGKARDKSVVIFALFGFTVLFWMAFEQAGNALNIWADMHTDLHLVRYPYPAEYFQFVNPIFIIVLAPVLASLWVFLGRKGREPSTPAKMLFSVAMMALSFGAMVASARAENSRTTRVPLAHLPEGASLATVDAGRLRYDPEQHELEVRGVLPPFAVTRALETVAPPTYHAELAKLSSVDAEPRDRLLRQMVPADYAQAVDALAAASNQARTSGIWLVIFYFCATLAELCLSPVGLSMVTKLAPLRFGSLFMGVWMLGLSVAQYVGGSLGENWGKVTPTSYFATFVWTSLAGAVVLAALVVPLRNLMHDAAR